MNAVSKVDESTSKAVTPAPITSHVPAKSAPQPRKRRRSRFVLMLAVPLALALGGGYFWVNGGRYQETENANLRQARVTISAETAGRIVTVDVTENMAVKAGDLLFAVDPEPYRIALDQANAAVEAARLNVEQLRAAYSQALAQEKVAAGEVDYLKSEYDRQTTLADKGINTRSALDEARRDWQKAENEHLAAVEGIASARAALGGNPDIETDKHPAVMEALAAQEKANFNLSETTVRAPSDGVISQASSFKAGQFVSVGTPLFTLVETQDSWIEANFKETQLTHMRPGQPAEVEFDAFPGRTYRARVDAVGAGTGAEFSLLPAQNATGNWVKVTQRVPVRLTLEDADAALPLRTGMSAAVTVDTGVARGLGALWGHAFAGEPADQAVE
ncbi:MAG: HlyD family secretion protein [Rhizobiaceae bacterium]|nr:HlyD family secretion protein [Rhizobiaceae bacterium]